MLCPHSVCIGSVCTRNMHNGVAVDVGGSTADQTLACNIVAQLVKLGARGSAREALRFAFHNADKHFFEIRVSRGLDLLTGDDVRQLAAQGRRVSDVRLLPERSALHIEVRRSADKQAAGFSRFIEQTERKEWHISIDWDKSGISDEDDQHTVLALIDEVYNMQLRIPDIRCWIEPVTAAGSVPDASTDASESAVASVADTDVVAYAVCFTGLPSFSGAFLNHLQSRYDGRLLQTQFWLQPPGKSTAPILSLLLRKATHTVKQVGSVVDLYTPRGNPVATDEQPKKRRRVF